jgi:hypothetical protein
MTATTAVRERPILFSAEMVRLILVGEKTQTRRVVRLPQWIEAGDRDEAFAAIARHPAGVSMRGPCDGLKTYHCPFGAPGDRLWVRETWCQLDRDGWAEQSLPADHLSNRYGTPRRNGVAYRAECDEESERCRVELGYQWRPSIHMPRWASRLTLEIITIGVERLQDICDADAIAEGAWFDGTFWRGGVHPIKGTLQCWPSPKLAFKAIWRTINGEESWAQNPWVWAVSFTVVPQNGGAS